MVEEIITALSRIRWLFVIARNSSFTYKGLSVDVKQVGRELGIRYVLEGSVRKGGNRVRITAQLIEAETGTHLWADRFDGLIEDVFELQDQVATSVAGVIEPTLQAAEIRRSAERPTTDLPAYDLYLCALPLFFSLTEPGIRQALDLFEQAIARDPRYGPALAFAAVCHVRLHADGWSQDPEADRRQATDLARRATQASGSDPGVLVNAALALSLAGENIGAMITMNSRALTLNPSFARGWYLSAGLRNVAGQPDIAIQHVEKAMRLSPRDRSGAPLLVLGWAYFLNRQFDAAAATLLSAIQEHPGHPQSHRFLASCYAHMGRLDEAREVVERLRAIAPVVVTSGPYGPLASWSNPEHRELFLSGLRLAAGKEP